MKLLFRVDASSQIGSGHLMRCLALARGLKAKGVGVTFACRELTLGMLDIAEAEFPLLRLPAQYGNEALPASVETPVPWVDDLAALEAVLDNAHYDWCVVDHYGLDACWEEGARTFADRIMAIDDLANRPHAADLLLDQNLTGTEAAYAQLVPGQCRFLFGPAYALLREEFSSLCERHHTGEVPRVLVNFGGTDPTGETMKAMEALARVNGIEVEVVAGKANPMWQTIREYCHRQGWQALHYVDDMAARMCAADVAIGAGGTSTWERAAMGLPAICIAVAGNQIDNARLMAEQGAQLFLGRSDETSVDMIVTALTALLGDQAQCDSLSQKSRQLVDGAGVARACDALLAYLP